MIYIDDVGTALYSAKVRTDYDTAFQAFLRAYPAYQKTAALDELRRREYGRLDDEGHIYLDYTGGGLYAASQVQRHLALLKSHVFGNPHSQNPTSLDMTQRVHRVRGMVLRHFNASPDEYVVIFTANASGAIKLVGEAYPFNAQGRYLLTADNHNSVNGIRQFAAARGAAVAYTPVIPPGLRLDTNRLALNLELATPGAPNLFAFPAQSNYSGVQHPLEWVAMAQANGWDVLLDGAAYVATNRLDLSACRPDFVSLSFYKIFGYPTGIGCLLARRAALAKLARPWFAGGTVSFASVRTGRHLLAPDETGFEDGTVNYLTIPAVEIGLQFINEIGIELIHERVAILTGWLIETLPALHHDNGRPLVHLHGPKNLERRGGTLAMNFYDPAGRPFDVYQIEQLANRAKISLRTGCFCNPGASEIAHDLPAPGLEAYRQAQPVLTPSNMNRYMQRQYARVAAATRVSVGLATNFADVYGFMTFLRRLVNKQASDISLLCGLVFALVYTILGGAGGLQSVQAQPGSATYTVTTTNNDGPGSLRQAILDANANAGADDIVFDIPGCTDTTPCVISLLSPLPVISDPLTITGMGMTTLIIDANSSFRGLNVADVPVTIADVTVQNGATPGRGAGIRSFGDLTLIRVRLWNNQAEDNGGGVYAAGTLTVNESRFAQNGSLKQGGGLYAGSGLVVSNSEFDGNSGDYGGGLIASATAVLSETVFISNVAWYGGGLFAYGEVQVSQGSFEANVSMEDGGGMYVIGDLTLTNSALLDNSASDDGGGLVAAGDIRILDSTFSGNAAQNGSGGGLSFPVPAITTLGGGSVVAAALTRTHFISNTAFHAGGGVSTYAPLLVNSSTFVGNVAGTGGGVYHRLGDGLVVNSLFARNRAHTAAAALALESSGVVAIKQATMVGEQGNNVSGIELTTGSLLLGNTIIAQYAAGIRNLNGDLHQDYNLFYQNGTDIDGNFSGGANSRNGDPKFVAPVSGDFHIGAGSAALDVGTNAGVTVDFEGDARPLGNGFDIGFDEADLITALTISYSPTPTVTVQSPVLFTATVAGGSGVTYAWDFGDGSPAESGNPVSHSYATAGLYQVNVTATNSSGSVSAAVEVAVTPGDIVPPEYKLLLPLVLK